MTMLSSGVSTTHDRNRAWSVTPPGRYPDTGMLAAQDCTKSAPEPDFGADPQGSCRRKGPRSEAWKSSEPQNLRNRDLGGAHGRATRTRIARSRASDLSPIVAETKAARARSPREIAAGLNQRGIQTARGGCWSAIQVKRVLEKA